MRYNDGSDIEPEKFNEVRTELLDRFGGFTIAPYSLEGGWIDPNDKIRYFDRTKLFEVTINQTNDNEEFLREYKTKLKKRFKQHELYMIVTTVYTVD